MKVGGRQEIDDLCPEIVFCRQIEKQDHCLGQRKLHQRLFDHSGHGNAVIVKYFFDWWPVGLEATSDDADVIESHLVIADQPQDLLGYRADFIVDAKGVEDLATPIFR